MMATNSAMMPAASAPTFRRIKVRHTMFKVGVGCLFLSTVLFIIGYSAPAWVHNQGLWMDCGWLSCISTVNEKYYPPAWLNAVRAMETLALVCFLFCVAVELYQDVFKSPPPPENKAVEILAGLAGTLGMIGIIIYGISAKPLNKERVFDENGQSYIKYTRANFQWGYGFASTGCILVLISCLLIACSRVKHATQTQQVMATAGVLVPGSASASPGITGAGQPLQATVPMQPMHPMQMPPAGHYPYMPTYPYPAPAMTPMMSPTPVMPAATMPIPQGVPSSQVPAYFVMVQGHMVPVYNEMPPTSATTTAAVTSPTVVPMETPDADGKPKE